MPNLADLHKIILTSADEGGRACTAYIDQVPPGRRVWSRRSPSSRRTYFEDVSGSYCTRRASRPMPVQMSCPQTASLFHWSSHRHFKCENDEIECIGKFIRDYLTNGDRYGNHSNNCIGSRTPFDWYIYIWSRTNSELTTDRANINMAIRYEVACRLAYLDLTLTYSEGQLGRRHGVTPDCLTFLFIFKLYDVVKWRKRTLALIPVIL